ncbi:MAG: hypothetical protein ACYDD0_08870 [Candidatus Dormibacteria bacterium]
MAEVRLLDAEDRAALAQRHHSRGHSEALLVELPESMSPTLAEALVRELLATAETAGKLGATLQAGAKLPGPATLVAIHEREAAWRDLETRYGLLRAAELADTAGSGSRNRSEYASALRRAGRLLGVRRGRRMMFPGFQFDEHLRPRRGIEKVLSVFREAGWSAESVALWFTAPNGYLDDEEPAVVLARDPSLVAEEAANAVARL